MEKLFCDICGSLASRGDSIEYYRTPNLKPEGFDKTARIRVSVYFSFVYHSTGWAGPPDLCRECKVRLIEELILDKFPT